VKEELVERLEPTFTGWFGRVNPFAFDPKTLDYAADARRLETGTPPVFAAVAARAGMELIEDADPRRIEARIEELSAHAIKSAAARDLEYSGPDDVRRKGATTAITVPEPAKIEGLLKGRGIIAAARGDVIRIAPHFFTTTEDIDRALDELRSLLRHQL
jgi:selenocysteine lyase/cysteine desulfurase